MNWPPGMAGRTPTGYRGRIAPSTTGHLHLGHARTFWTAHERARAANGTMILRLEDIDPERCRPEFAADVLEDLRWFGFSWHEGPDVGGPCQPYIQSQRRAWYVAALQHLVDTGVAYACRCSRRDVQQSASAPHAGDEEPVYAGTCRGDRSLLDAARPWLPEPGARRPVAVSASAQPRVNWRFRVPDGRVIRFVDGHFGPQSWVAGRDFGDFVLWRHDDVPAYQLAVVVDDAAMGVTEVVRGADLLVSTARQWLIYEALGWPPPAFYHCPLVTDAQGIRLAKRNHAMSLRTLRAQGQSPEGIREGWTGHAM